MSARWSRPVRIARLRAPQEMRIEASETERKAIADALDLVSLDTLVADLTVRPFRGEGVRVSGTVEAALTQACVVTLEDVPAPVLEAFDVRLHPDASDPSSITVDPEAEDPPEPLESETVDVGAIALEHFVLGIDPYPKAPDAVLEPNETQEEERASPFAALGALKNRSR